MCWGRFRCNRTVRRKEFLVEIYWPDGGSNDINYAGNNYGTSINVDAAASQVPFSGTNPGQENPPQQEQFVVKYETTISLGKRPKRQLSVRLSGDDYQ